MFINILQYFIISFILILLIHYLYNFFKTNLTIPKVKDLIHKPKERYDEMYESIKYNKIYQNILKPYLKYNKIYLKSNKIY